MKIHTLSPMLLACLTWLPAAHAQLPKPEQKTAFCASSVELLRSKRDSNDVYLCETSERTCGPYLKPSCLEDAKKGDWDVTSETRQTLLKDFANTPCNCVGTQYVLTRKISATAQPPVTPPPTVAAASTTAAATASMALTPAALPTSLADTPTGSLASEVEALKKDNLQIRRLLEQLQRQFEELRRSLPLAR
jgi:hypothetical protein